MDMASSSLATLGDGNVRFLGEFVCAGYEFEQAPDSTGAMRQAIVFNLAPSANIAGEIGVPAQSSITETSDLPSSGCGRLEQFQRPLTLTERRPGEMYTSEAVIFEPTYWRGRMVGARLAFGRLPSLR